MNLYSVLAADDDPGFQVLYQRVIEDAGCRCDVVGNGDECLEKLRSQSYQLAILDMIMPGTDPEELLKTLRRDYPQTRVVFASVNDDPVLIENLLAQGATAYLTKPFSIEELESVVLRICNESGGAP